MHPIPARVILATICVTILATAAVMTAFGPLAPPGGAVSSTAKTLAEVEPRIAVNSTNTPGSASAVYVISVPGSYYLTGNIQGTAGKHGIQISADGVTLDLNGFDLNGVAGTLDGVSVAGASYANTLVMNGSIRNWGARGVDYGSANARNGRVERLRVIGCANGGIYLGAACSASDCTAQYNASHGFIANIQGVFTGCCASLNTANGFELGSGSTLRDCTAYANTGIGINANTGAHIAHCAVRYNTLDGIRVSNACTVLNNTCSSNGLSAGDGANIHATAGDNRIEGNNCVLADRGIDIDSAGNFITRNTCSGNITNWDVVNGNILLVVSAASSGGFVGNAGGAAPGSTDPNANFSY